MIKSIDVTGKNEDEAINSALRQLGLAREDVSVEILERSKSGIFGIGASPALVRVSYEYIESKTEKATAFLQGLFQHMDINATPSVTSDNGERVEIVVEGENLGGIIGRRGETLDAIQLLTNYAINKDGAERVRINIDAENYRAKRTETLEKLAAKVAAKVVKYRRNVTLEPMNAYERHVIHTALQDNDEITTYSTGSEPNRRVVVAYARPEKEDDTSSASPYTREWK